MFERIAWGFCKLAFDASREEGFPEPMRRAFRRFGTLWFWLALLLEGRALAAILERGPARRSFQARWTGLGQRAKAAWHRLRPRAIHGASESLPVVPAWSLPDLPQLQKLGLGQVWAVRCPFCCDFHTHHPGEGSRQAACTRGPTWQAYALRYAGELPRMLHDPFRLSIGQTWPKLLLEWPRHDATPSLLKAA
jgi:hypothetical protein